METIEGRPLGRGQQGNTEKTETNNIEKPSKYIPWKNSPLQKKTLSIAGNGTQSFMIGKQQHYPLSKATGLGSPLTNQNSINLKIKC